MIETIEGRITLMMEEEMRQKVEQQRLLDGIKMMEERSQNKASIKNRLHEEHRLNMKYFDEKISNHEETFFKFKNLYENLKSSNCNNSFMKNNSSQHTQKSSNGFLKGEKKTSNL
jgi:hypothetical protein